MFCKCPRQEIFAKNKKTRETNTPLSQSWCKFLKMSWEWEGDVKKRHNHNNEFWALTRNQCGPNMVGSMSLFSIYQNIFLFNGENSITDGGSTTTLSKAIMGWTDGWTGSNLGSYTSWSTFNPIRPGGGRSCI